MSRPSPPPGREPLLDRAMLAGAGAAARAGRETRSVVSTFLAVRGTHVAALIAFYALLAFFPLVFITLAIAGLFGEQQETSYLIEQLQRAFPGTSAKRLAKTVNDFGDQAVLLGLLGGVGLLWSSIGLFSALESALNIVYGLRNRTFAHGKALMLTLVAGSIALMFAALGVGSLGVGVLLGVGGLATTLAYGFPIALSSLLIFGLVWTLYRVLPNTFLTWRETLPGAVGAAVALSASFQAVPLFVGATDSLVALRAFGGATLLLVWLFLMANILVLGAVVNWRLAARAEERRAYRSPGQSTANRTSFDTIGREPDAPRVDPGPGVQLSIGTRPASPAAAWTEPDASSTTLGVAPVTAWSPTRTGSPARRPPPV
ncbi:MAG: YihY/virulence factor BrkB family protein [Gaiellales bacterium]